MGQDKAKQELATTRLINTYARYPSETRFAKPKIIENRSKCNHPHEPTACAWMRLITVRQQICPFWREHNGIKKDPEEMKRKRNSYST
jgi:hypothetical protein